MAKALEKQLGQSIVVQNKPGGGTAVGIAALAASKPDGYTFGTTLTTGPSLIPHMMDVSYDLESLEYIMIVGRYLFGVAVKADSPHKSLKDVIEYAKAHPGQVKYSVSGTATPETTVQVSVNVFDDFGSATGASRFPTTDAAGAFAASFAKDLRAGDVIGLWFRDKKGNFFTGRYQILASP